MTDMNKKISVTGLRRLVGPSSGLKIKWNEKVQNLSLLFQWTDTRGHCGSSRLPPLWYYHGFYSESVFRKCCFIVRVSLTPGHPVRSRSVLNFHGCGHGTDDGVAVRVLYVFSGGPHHRPVGSSPLPQPTPPEPPVPGRDRPLPVGAALQRRGDHTDGAWPRWGRGGFKGLLDGTVLQHPTSLGWNPECGPNFYEERINF